MTIPICTVWDTQYPAPRRHPATTTRFVLISDTHGQLLPLQDIPPGDVLIHTGDLSSWGNAQQVKETLLWFGKLPHTHKIFIAGNNDSALDPRLPRHIQPHTRTELDEVARLLRDKYLLQRGVHYLNNDAIQIQIKPNGRLWSIYGSPWSPRHKGAPSFTYTPDRAYEKLAGIHPGIDILLTHGPPAGTSSLDYTARGTHAGCPVLANLVAYAEPWMHVFGHVHEGRGVEVRRTGSGRTGVGVNACIARPRTGRSSRPQAGEYRGPIVVDFREDLM